MKKKLLPVLLLPLLAFAAPPVPGVVMEMVNTDMATGETWTSTMSVIDNDLLMEFSDPRSNTSGSMVYLAGSEEMIFNDDQNQTYVRINRAQMEEMAERIGAMMKQVEDMLENLPAAQREMIERSGGIPGMPDFGERPVISIEATGETDRMEGYPVTRYDMIVGDRKTQEMWVTDWSNLDGAAEVRGAFEGFAGLMSSFMEAMPPGMFDGGGFERLMDYDRGAPVVSYELDEEGNRAVETKLQSIGNADVDRSKFGPRDGYNEQKIEMPGM